MPGQWLIPKAGGEAQYIPAEDVGDAINSGLYQAPGAGAKVGLTDPTSGLAYEVPASQLEGAQGATGFGLQTEAEGRSAERSARLEAEHGGLGGQLITGLEQGLDTATFGGYGLLAEASAGKGYTEKRGERLEVNPEGGTVGTIAGAIAPGLLTGGEGGAAAIARATPAGAASRAAEAIVGLGKGRGAIAGAASAAGGYGLEGALFGAGHVLSETVLHDKELSGEAFVAGAKEGALWGGAAGGAGSLLSRGAKAAAGKFEEIVSKKADARQLATDLRAAEKEAQAASKMRDRLALQRDRQLNQRGLEELRQKGRLEAIEAKGGVQKDVAGIKATAQETVAKTKAEAQLGLADTALEKELAKAEARVAVARTKVDAVSERLAVEQERSARAQLVMDGRLQLADTYTSGWRRAADSREVVAASKLEAAGVNADAKIRTGMAEALASTGRSEAGTLIEELIPARMRTQRAVKAAQGNAVMQASRLAASTDDLVRQADQLMAVNPMAAAEIHAARQAAAESVPMVGAWSEKALTGADDFADGFTTLRQAEQAQHDLAQAMAPHLDEVGQAQLAELTAGMDEAVAKTDDIMTDAIAKQVEARGARAAGGTDAGDTAAVADLLMGAAGMPNADDIPAIGPVLGAYLKFRAARGALGKLGIRLPGPVGRIAQIGTSVQNQASNVVGAVLRKAPAVAAKIESTSVPVAAVMSRPLWEPAEGGRQETDREPTPRQQFDKRVEEVERAVADTDATRKRILESVPAPPAVQAAIADTQVRKLEYLAQNLPRDWRPPTVMRRPYQAGPAEVQRFTELAYAVEYPVAAVKRALEGTIGPHAMDAVKSVYPRLFQAMQQELIERVSEAENPAYPALVRASLLFDIPLDTTTHPEYIAARQAEYAAEKQSAPQPMSGGGPQLALSKTEELGSTRRAMR